MEVTGIAGRRRRPHRDEFRPEGSEEEAAPLKRAGVIVNPTKFTAVAPARGRLTATCKAQGWGEPFWYETTIADPGTGQARKAGEEGAGVICPLGGGGTLRRGPRRPRGARATARPPARRHWQPLGQEPRAADGLGREGPRRRADRPARPNRRGPDVGRPERPTRGAGRAHLPRHGRDRV